MIDQSIRALRVSAVLVSATIMMSAARLMAQTPTGSPSIFVQSGVPAVTLHAEGAEIYECRADEHKRLAWRSREPIATLFLDGDTVGRHYAGLRWGHVDESKLRWEYGDGSAVQAKIAASTAGTYANDIPWLKMDVVTQTGGSVLFGMTAVQRINTRRGMAAGACGPTGSFLSVPFSADYVFWRED